MPCGCDRSMKQAANLPLQQKTRETKSLMVRVGSVLQNPSFLDSSTSFYFSFSFHVANAETMKGQPCDVDVEKPRNLKLLPLFLGQIAVKYRRFVVCVLYPVPLLPPPTSTQMKVNSHLEEGSTDMVFIFLLDALDYKLQ